MYRPICKRARRERKSFICFPFKVHMWCDCCSVPLTLENTAEMAWNLKQGSQCVSSPLDCGGLPGRICLLQQWRSSQWHQPRPQVSCTLVSGNATVNTVYRNPLGSFPFCKRTLGAAALPR